MGIFGGGPWGFVSNLFGGGDKKKAPVSNTVYSGQPYNAAPQTPSYGQAYNMFNGMAAPQFAQIDQQQAQNRSRIAALQAQFNQAKGFMNTNLSLGNRQIDLGLEGLGIQKGGAERDFDSIVKLQNLLNDNYVREMAEVDKFQQLYGKGYEGQMGYTTTLEDLANQLFALQEYGRTTDYSMDKRKTTGQLAASGGFGGTGTSGTLGHLFSQFDTDIRGFKLGHEEKVAGIEEQRRALRQAYEEAMLGFEGQRGDLTYGYNTQAESLWNQADAKEDEIAMMDLKAREYGLQREQLAASLTQGLKNMQLSNAVNVNDIMAAIASGDVNRMLLAQQVMNQAMLVAGPPPPPAYQSPNTQAGSTVKRGKVW